MTASKQIAQTGGSTRAFCLKRVTAVYTFNPVNDKSYFTTTSGVLVFTKSVSVADKKTIKVTVTYQLDSKAFTPTAKTFSFNVKTSKTCTSPTF